LQPHGGRNENRDSARFDLLNRSDIQVSQLRQLLLSHPFPASFPAEIGSELLRTVRHVPNFDHAPLCRTGRVDNTAQRGVKGACKKKQHAVEGGRFMKARLCACSVAVFVVTLSIYAGADTNLYTVSALSGGTFSNVTVRRAEPDGVVFMTAKGVLKIAFTNLPAEWQQKYHYDPTAAAAFRQRQEASRLAAQSSPSVRLTPTERDRAFYEQNVKGLYLLMNGKAARWYGRVVQVIDAQRILFRFAGQDEPVVISMNATSNLYDDAVLDGPLLAERDGVFKYTSVGQGEKTVRAFRTEPMTFEKFMELRKSGVTFFYPPASIMAQPRPYPP